MRRYRAARIGLFRAYSLLHRQWFPGAYNSSPAIGVGWAYCEWRGNCEHCNGGSSRCRRRGAVVAKVFARRSEASRPRASGGARRRNAPNQQLGPKLDIPAFRGLSVALAATHNRTSGRKSAAGTGRGEFAAVRDTKRRPEAAKPISEEPKALAQNAWRGCEAARPQFALVPARPQRCLRSQRQAGADVEPKSRPARCRRRRETSREEPATRLQRTRTASGYSFSARGEHGGRTAGPPEARKGHGAGRPGRASQPAGKAIAEKRTAALARKAARESKAAARAAAPPATAPPGPWPLPAATRARARSSPLDHPRLGLDERIGVGDAAILAGGDAAGGRRAAKFD